MTMTDNKVMVLTVLENVADVMPFYSEIVAVVLLMYMVYKTRCFHAFIGHTNLARTR